MHQIGSHESNQFEKAVFYFGHLAQRVQDEIGNQGHSDLDAHSILLAPHEVGNTQRLLDQAEEELDLPASFVEIGDLPTRCIKVVCENA